uniref:Putative secreted protein n=1 Tax=Anopheles darlingi TaxID=43151 RepID=A0A2M4DD39_ANODA
MSCVLGALICVIFVIGVRNWRSGGLVRGMEMKQVVVQPSPVLTDRLATSSTLSHYAVTVLVTNLISLKCVTGSPKRDGPSIDDDTFSCGPSLGTQLHEGNKSNK